MGGDYAKRIFKHYIVDTLMRQYGSTALSDNRSEIDEAVEDIITARDNEIADLKARVQALEEKVGLSL
jgi:hypothetical protein